MIVKYVALIFGAIFEIYCINTFSSIFSKRKEINKLHFLIIITIISLFHILTSVFLKGISLAICSLLTVFIINQLYKSKQYVKIVLTIGKYSLQETTQGKYLTGGVPPVRFSM